MATLIMIGLGVLMVILVVVLVLLSNPPNKWVDRLGRGPRKED